MKGWLLTPLSECPKIREDAPFIPATWPNSGKPIGELVWVHESWLIKEEKKVRLSHQTISFIKSAIRILGYLLLPINLLAAATVLVVSEVVGVIEEIGH
jgi:hypothetical protein